MRETKHPVYGTYRDHGVSFFVFSTFIGCVRIYMSQISPIIFPGKIDKYLAFILSSKITFSIKLNQKIKQEMTIARHGGANI